MLVLNGLKVVKTMRSSQEFKIGLSSFMHLISRATARIPSEAVVEQKISMINIMNRENVGWEKLLTEIQFRDFGPFSHEDERLVELMYQTLKPVKGLRFTIIHKDLRVRRSGIEISKPVDRLRRRKSKFRGLIEM